MGHVTGAPTIKMMSKYNVVKEPKGYANVLIKMQYF